MDVCVLLGLVLLSMVLSSKALPHETAEDILRSTDKLPAGKTNFSAEGKGFNCIENICEDAEGYPQEHLRDINLSRFENHFKELEQHFTEPKRRAKRFRPVVEEFRPLCSFTKETKYPKTMKNEKDVEKFIVNDGEFTQGVVIEKCSEDQGHCGDFPFPVTFETKCIQKYTVRRLLSLETGSEPAFDTFVLPSCCICGIRNKLR